MSTETNRFSTDDSNSLSSNKRSRSNDGGPARGRIDNQPPNEVPIERKTKRNPTPYESGIVTANTYITLLHPGTHNVLSQSARVVLGAHATYYRAYAKYTKEKNNTAFILNARRFKLELQPMADVAKIRWVQKSD